MLLLYVASFEVGIDLQYYVFSTLFYDGDIAATRKHIILGGTGFLSFENVKVGTGSMVLESSIWKMKVMLWVFSIMTGFNFQLSFLFPQGKKVVYHVCVLEILQEKNLYFSYFFCYINAIFCKTFDHECLTNRSWTNKISLWPENEG
jgi:hypothetical protein